MRLAKGLVTSYMLLGGITLAMQAIPSVPTHFFVAWSVSLSSVTCVQLCTLLKPLDRFRCHLAGTLPGSDDRFC